MVLAHFPLAFEPRDDKAETDMTSQAKASNGPRTLIKLNCVLGSEAEIEVSPCDVRFTPRKQTSLNAVGE
jgi:hypothetical protein